MYAEGVTEDDVELPDEVEDEVELFYLHEDNLPAWEIFNIAKAYMSAYEEMPQQVVLRLIDHKQMDVEEGLHSIAVLHGSYLKVKQFLTKDKK